MESNDLRTSRDTNSVSLSLQPEPSNSPSYTSTQTNQFNPLKQSNKRKLESTNTNTNISSNQSPNKKRKINDMIRKCFTENRQLKKHVNSLKNDIKTKDEIHNQLLLEKKLLFKTMNNWRGIFNQMITIINEDNTVKNKINFIPHNISNMDINVNVNSIHKPTNESNTNVINNKNIIETNESGSDMDLESDNDTNNTNIITNIKLNENLKGKVKELIHRKLLKDEINVKQECESKDIIEINKKKKRTIKLKVTNKKKKNKKCNDIIYGDVPRTRSTMQIRHEHFQNAQKEYNKLQKDKILNSDNESVDLVLIE